MCKWEGKLRYIAETRFVIMMEKLLFGGTSNRAVETWGRETLSQALESRKRYKVWLMPAGL